MKKFAFYLPQFHEIPENNLWWGDGFTEWTNVKKAKPLFKKHQQPKIPLNNNYYDLMNMGTIKWQTELLHKYCIDGFIYYHYYFEGKLLLEKPAENLLRNKSINQQFFFCWANHSWSKTWNNSKEILIKQTYGDKKEWEKHFQYLLPFFKDSRYEKKDNMPLFMLFRSDFDCKNDMLNYFNNRCIDEGFAGLYIIESFLDGKYMWPRDLIEFINNKSSVTKKILLREPNTALNIYNSKKRFIPIKIVKRIKKQIYKMFGTNIPSSYSGNILYRLIEKEEPINKEIIHGLFFEWDNTPRHSSRGYIIMPPSEKKFKKLIKHFEKEEYIFINAWNEWAEGMMMEPTENNQYKYLEWMKG